MKADRTKKDNEPKKNWVTHPTRKILSIFVTIWFLGNGLLILVITDLFTEPFFNTRYMVIYGMMIMSTWTTFMVFLNYSKTKGTSEKT
jgi:hypothetical protein